VALLCVCVSYAWFVCVCVHLRLRALCVFFLKNTCFAVFFVLCVRLRYVSGLCDWCFFCDALRFLVVQIVIVHVVRFVMYVTV